MKPLFINLLIVLLSFPLTAQQETLVNGKIESGWYGGFFTKVGQLNGGTGVFMGGQGAWIINHKFGIGAKGYGIVNEVEADGLQNAKLEFGCYGGLIEYIISSDKLVHLTIQSMIGGGDVRYSIINYQNPQPEINYSGDGFFVMEPGIDLILNINKNFRLGAGVAYRLVSGVEYESLSNSDLNGVSAEILIKFGVF